MSIHASYIHGSVSIPNALVKLDRIWGSKLEGWNAWVHITDKDRPETSVVVFSINAEYVEDENPYTALYAKLTTVDFLTDIVHDHKSIEDVKSPVPKTKPKKIKSK